MHELHEIAQMYGDAFLGGLVLFAGLVVYVFIKGKIDQAARAKEHYARLAAEAKRAKQS